MLRLSMALTQYCQSVVLSLKLATTLLSSVLEQAQVRWLLTLALELGPRSFVLRRPWNSLQYSFPCYGRNSP